MHVPLLTGAILGLAFLAAASPIASTFPSHLTPVDTISSPADPASKAFEQRNADAAAQGGAGPVGVQDKRDSDPCQNAAGAVGCIWRRDANALLDKPPPGGGAVAVGPVSRRGAEAEAEPQVGVGNAAGGPVGRRDADPCQNGPDGPVGAVGCNRKRDAEASQTGPVGKREAEAQTVNGPIGKANKRDAEALQKGPEGAVGKREAEAEAEAQVNGNQDKRDADASPIISDPVGNPDRSPAKKRYAVPFQAVSFPVGVNKRDASAQVGNEPEKRDAQVVNTSYPDTISEAVAHLQR